MDWITAALSKDILLKVCGRLGGDKERGDIQEIRCLNRVIRWEEGGLTMEADPRHAELLAKMLGTGAKPLSTPGVKQRTGGTRIEHLTRHTTTLQQLAAERDDELRKLYRQVFGDVTGNGPTRERESDERERTEERGGGYEVGGWGGESA